MKGGEKYRRSTAGGLASIFVSIAVLLFTYWFFSTLDLSEPSDFVDSQRRRLEMGGTITRSLPKDEEEAQV